MPEDQPLTVKQVAKELGVANTRVMALVRRGDIAATRPGGPGTWRIKREELDDYLEATRLAALAREQARYLKTVKAVVDAWGKLPERERQELAREAPRDLFQPLVRLVDPTGTQRRVDAN